MRKFKPGDKIFLTAKARERFPDIGVRPGIVQRTEGWIVVRWTGLDGETRLPPTDFENVDDMPSGLG